MLRLAHVLLLPVACAAESPIQEDERVIFYPSPARLSADGSSWIVDIHGWIHEPEVDSWFRKRALGLFQLALGLGLEDGAKAAFERRARPFLADNERGKVISVRIGEKEHALEESAASGHFRGTVTVPVRDIALPGATPDSLRFRAVTRPGDERVFEGEAPIVGETGISVISDIDDTIKVSEVRDRKQLILNTFVRELRAVPGMAALYATWASAGASFHYVSGSPWQLYEPILELIRANGFPAGTFHMKDLRWKDSTVIDLFSSQEEYKRSRIDPLLRAFPRRSFILVGDSGEQDPEIYAAVLREHPEQVRLILIRDVTGEDGASARMKKAFEGIPEERWKVFREPADLPAIPGLVTGIKAGGQE